MSLDAESAKRFISERVMEALTSIGDEVEGNMKSDCPVDTGFLRNSIGHDIMESEDLVSLEFYATAPYAVFVDKGTSKMEAQPFFDKNLIGLERKIQEAIT